MNPKIENRVKQTFSLYEGVPNMLLDICLKRSKERGKREKMSSVVCDGIRKIWEEEVNNQGE